MNAQDLKNSILQLAIQGKLVEQRKEEGTAKELIEEIKAEKESLIREKKIKKEKTLAEITEDEVPFEIPESWEWVRLKTIVYNKGQMTPNEKFSYIDIGSINNREQKLNSDENIIEPSKAPSRARKIVDYGDILYSTVRPYLHNMCIIDRDFIHQPIASTGFAVMTCCSGVYNKFLFYYLLSPSFDSYANSNENSKGVTYPAINDERLYRSLVPIPPITEQKRIVAKIEELMPYIEKYGEAHSKLEVFNKKFPEDMQKSILQYAIQGKLVEQREEEGTAEELYKQIQEEKEKLIKEKKIKKEKTLAEITEDEVPFEIPESWKWVRMGRIFNIHSSKRIFAKDYVMAGIPFFRSMEVVALAKNIEPTISYYISHEKYNEIKESYILPQKNDLLIACIGGSIGWNWIVDEREFYYKDGNIVAFDYNKKMSMEFLQLWLKSPSFMEQVKIDVSGTAYNALTIEMLKGYLIPLPPFEEQKRIVTKIKEMLPYCQQLVK
jgi:Restriction endonuclease S subunits